MGKSFVIWKKKNFVDLFYDDYLVFGYYGLGFRVFFDCLEVYRIDDFKSYNKGFENGYVFFNCYNCCYNG